MNTWITLPLAILLLSGGSGCWACEFSPASTCVNSALTTYAAALQTTNFTIICRAEAESKSALDSCLVGCDQAILDQLKQSVDAVRQSLSTYEMYCKPGCENFIERQQAIGNCIGNGTNYGEIQDYRKLCNITQNLANCVFDKIGNCSSLEEASAPYKVSVVNHNALYGCSIQIHGETPGVENQTQCGQSQELIATVKCFNDSLAEYGLDVAPGHAGGINYGAFSTFSQALASVQSTLLTQPTQLPEFCQKVSQRSLRKGANCVKSLRTRCPKEAGILSEEVLEMYGSLCDPACANYTTRLGQASFCLGMSGIVAVPKEDIEKSIRDHGAESEYCGPANQTVECLYPFLNGCGLTISYYHSLLADQTNGLALLLNGCNIEVEFSVQEPEEEQTTPTSQTEKPLGKDTSNSSALGASLLGICLAALFLKVF